MNNYTEHRTCSRILNILELVSEHDEGMSFSEIISELDIPKGSIHPLIQTLVARKYLIYNDDTQKYFLGESLFILGNKYLSKVNIMDQIKEKLTILTNYTDETTYFGVLSGSDVLYLLKSESTNAIRITASVANKLPAYSTGFGKSILSQFNLEELKQLYPDGLKAITPYTITDINVLAEQCQKTRETGIASECQESTLGIRCMATPIYLEQKVVAGISIAIPIYRYDENKKDLFIRYMLETRNQIEQILELNKSQWYQL